ncbi:hypothetical protein F5Y11DRAFT_348187 [Daldinia sp. FL1419]|nr:hypothetical protein F5Y11DRAFT_348187 [Daldinia sp. FL1419]
MLPPPRTPSPRYLPPNPQGQLSPPSIQAASGEEMTPAIARCIVNQGIIGLTSLSGENLLSSNDEMLQEPIWQSPFDSPTTDTASSSAAKLGDEQVKIIEEIRTRSYYPSYPRFSAYGTPTRTTCEPGGWADQSLPEDPPDEIFPAVFDPWEKDPVPRFLTGEFLKLATESSSRDNTLNIPPSSLMPQIQCQVLHHHEKIVAAVEDQYQEPSNDIPRTSLALAVGIDELRFAPKSPAITRSKGAPSPESSPPDPYIEDVPPGSRNKHRRIRYDASLARVVCE